MKVSLVRVQDAGQWSFQLVDEQGQALPSTRSNDGQKVDFKEVDPKNCAAGSTICVMAVYEDPDDVDQKDEVTHIDNGALIDSLELGGSGGGSSSSGGVPAPLAVARINPAQALQRPHKHITTLSGRMCTVLKPLVMKQTLVRK